MSYTTCVTEKQIDRLAADMGGVFGLYIGFSVLTFAEFLEYMVNLIALGILTYKEKYNNRRKTSPADDAKSSRPSSASSTSRLKSKSIGESSLAVSRPVSAKSILVKPAPKNPSGSPPSYSTVYLQDDRVLLSPLSSGLNSDQSDCDSVGEPAVVVKNHVYDKSNGAIPKVYTSPLSTHNVSSSFSGASKQPSSETANQKEPLSDIANQQTTWNYGNFVIPPFSNTSTNLDDVAQNKEPDKEPWDVNRFAVPQIS